MNKNISVNGDTRFDRVIAIADNFIPVREIEEFVGDTKVIVAGSTWTEDDKGLNHYVNTHPAISFIIVPHEIIQERLNECLKLYKNAILYSQWKTIYKNWEGEYIHSPISHINCLIIDNIGMLSRLYHYATVCYVGGGFGKDGLHNVLEAAVYGKPVIFGPIYEKFNEAVALVESGGGISITGPLKLEEALNRLVNDEEEIKKRGNRARDFVYANAGASQRIVDFIQEKRLLTS